MPPAWYLDAARVAIIEETIKKEQRIQRRFLQSEVAAGRIKPWAPPPPKPAPSTLERYGLPEYATAAAPDPEAQLGDLLSRNMWTANPGYISRDGPRLASVSHQDYAWPSPEALATLRSAGAFDCSFHRRRDEFVDYVEKAIKLGHSLGGRPSAAAGSGGGSKRRGE